MQKNLKHSWKRLLACLLAVVMLVGVVPMADIGGTAIKASATSKTVNDALDWVNTAVANKTQYGNGQCVALIRAYYEFLGVAPVAGNAKDYANMTLPSGWSYSSTPSVGDIAVNTGSMGGGYGHVVIVTAIISSTTFQGADQHNLDRYYVGIQNWSNSKFSKYIHPNFSSEPSDNPTGIKYKNLSISDISTKDAKITCWISNPTGKTIWSTGFWFGTDPDNLSLYVVHTKINWTDFCCDYQISKYCGELSPGTTYYYRFYTVEEENFNYTQSEMCSFKTNGLDNVHFGNVETVAVSSLDATISSWAWNDNGYTISSCGFYFGDSPTSMKKYQVYSNITWTNFHTQVNVTSYTGVLTPGKTYYYRFYAVVDTNYYSDVYTFTTKERTDDNLESSSNPNGIEYKNLSISDISTKDAKITCWISNPTGKTIWSTGFWFGTDPDNLSLYVVYSKINWTDFCCDYQISKYCGELSPGTTYYYRFYTVEEENFNYTQSEMCSFKTNGLDNVHFGNVETIAVSSLDATISSWAWNDNGYTISSCGFYFGDSPTSMKKYQVYDNIAWTNFHTQVDVASYTGVLTPGKTYYYRFYAVVDTNYYSDVYSLTTNSTLPQFTVSFVASPDETISLKTVTYSSTYGTLPTPTRTGYTFDGWYTSATGGTEVTSSSKVTAIGNHTLYAHWTCNHSYTSQIVTAATCNSTGTKKYTCKTCGNTYTETIAKNANNHTGGTELKNAKSATCTEAGYTGDTCCKGCSVVLTKGSVIPATGNHSFGAWKQTKAPTCTAKGEKTRTCSVCGKTETLAVDKIAHTYTATVTEATCTEDGKTVYTCSCGDTYSEGIPAKGHHDEDADGTCDACGQAMSNISADCSCRCHKTGLNKFIYKIILIFWKLFRINKTCACGVSHY